MPTSNFRSIPAICSEFERRQPIDSVLDIGIGNGKYGFLAREYINDPPVEIVDGVEVYPGYIRKTHKGIYNHIYAMDITKDFHKIKPTYDLILMIDVIEHMSKEDGHKILDYFYGVPMIVSTPKVFFTQQHKNPFEEHVSHWTKEDFANYPSKDISVEDNLILVLHP